MYLTGKQRFPERRTSSIFFVNWCNQIIYFYKTILDIRAFTCRCATEIFPPKYYSLAEHNGETQKKNNGPPEIYLWERRVQTDHKTMKERDPPNICLFLLHDRFRRESSTLRWLLCWRQEPHTKKRVLPWAMSPHPYCRTEGVRYDQHEFHIGDSRPFMFQKYV